MQPYKVIYILSIFLLVISPCWSQPELPDLPEYDPVFDHFRELRSGGQDPIPELDRIITEHSGTKIDAYARLQKAMELVEPGNIEIILSILESIIADFPGSREAMFARSNIIDYHHDTNFGPWKVETNELFQDAGAPPLEELWSGDARPRPAPTQLNKDEHDDLCALLILEAGDIYFDEVSTEQVVNLDTYLVLNYPERFDGRYCADAISQQIDHELNPYTGQVTVESIDAPEFVPPVLTFEPPFVNGANMESPVNVKIRAQDGTLSESSLMDLTTAEFIVDGQKIEQLYGKSSIENGRWECVLSIEEEFALGEHQGTFRISDLGENEAEIEFHFTVIDRPQSLVLPALGDSILSLRNQHENDGANNLLTLEKVQGKATRSAVAFDLANTNLDYLSQATLVLNIDPSEGVNGWGNGRTISVQTITTPWVEGNGMNFGLKNKDQEPGSGSGTTWFSPIDEDISNDSSNSAVNWNGGGIATNPPTAPAVVISNLQSGEVLFDVTGDVLNGADNGWLILKDQENVGSKISFYSREGAAAAGDPDLAPRLILEFGDPVASTVPPSNSLLSKIGLGSIGTRLHQRRDGSELRSIKEVLQENPVAALAAEQIILEATRSNPLLSLTSRVAYRTWLAEEIQIAASQIWTV